MYARKFRIPIVQNLAELSLTTSLALLLANLLQLDSAIAAALISGQDFAKLFAYLYGS